MNCLVPIIIAPINAIPIQPLGEVKNAVKEFPHTACFEVGIPSHQCSPSKTREELKLQ
jgi:hypothetical protein